MDLSDALAFFFIGLALSVLPSSSVALVVTRSVTHGVRNGVAVAIGIVLGDLIFIALALLGMGIVAETMGAFFAVIKYVGGAYLIWLGFSLFRARVSFSDLKPDSSSSSLMASALAGLALTLGDLKAILFYASLFPSLVNVSALSVTDVSIIVGVTIVSLGGVKVIYAVAARRIVEKFFKVPVSRHMRPIAGSMLIGTGTYFIVKS